MAGGRSSYILHQILSSAPLSLGITVHQAIVKMSNYPPTLERKSSMPWERLKPIKQDPLEAVGFVSKGDTKLLNPRAQETFYQRIVARYMKFCANRGPDLDASFLALLAKDKRMAPMIRDLDHDLKNAAASDVVTTNVTTKAPDAAEDQKTELAVILTALRKLREGLLASWSNTTSPHFSQRVHIFNIRVAILAQDDASYHPSLTYLLNVLHTREFPLPKSEVMEMTTYAILDRALRQEDLIAAYNLKYKSRERFGYENRTIDALLQAVVANNWVSFWRIRRKVDGYVRALMNRHLVSLRKSTLKALGRAYMKADLDWVLQSATGAEMSWEQLVEMEQVGWHRDGKAITIRKPRAK